MKRIATWALLLSIGLFIVGCNKTDAKKEDKMGGTPPPAEGAAPPADAPK